MDMYSLGCKKPCILFVFMREYGKVSINWQEWLESGFVKVDLYKWIYMSLYVSYYITKYYKSSSLNQQTPPVSVYIRQESKQGPHRVAVKVSARVVLTWTLGPSSWLTHSWKAWVLCKCKIVAFVFLLAASWWGEFRYCWPLLSLAMSALPRLLTWQVTSSITVGEFLCLSPIC